MDSTDFVGVDIAKNKFDICLLKEDGSFLQNIFNNTSSGFKELLTWLKTYCNNPWVCMEATGHYSEYWQIF